MSKSVSFILLISLVPVLACSIKGATEVPADKPVPSVIGGGKVCHVGGVNGGGKLGQVGGSNVGLRRVEGQGKCPAKCSA